MTKYQENIMADTTSTETRLIKINLIMLNQSPSIWRQKSKILFCFRRFPRSRGPGSLRRRQPRTRKHPGPSKATPTSGKLSLLTKPLCLFVLSIHSPIRHTSISIDLHASLQLKTWRARQLPFTLFVFTTCSHLPHHKSWHFQ